MCVDMEERDLPIIFSSLKLFQLLNSLHTENEDFEEAWNAEIPTLETKLFDLLRNSRGTSLSSLEHIYESDRTSPR